MLSPEQIRKRAANRYEDFLRSLTMQEAFFPLRLFGSGMSQVADYAKARDAIAELRNHSKEIKKTGYSVEWKQQTFRRYAEQQMPGSVLFATREDYTQFLGKCAEVRRFEQDYALIVGAFPEIAEWARRYPLKLVEHAGDWSGMISVCTYLRAHGRPNCYLRELPVDVDTKFIERKQRVLAELLPILAPNCVGPDASTFETRFGFRQKQPLVRFRALDERLVAPGEMPFADFAIPLDEASRSSINASNVLVVENETTFLTLPKLAGTLALLGAGDSVAVFRQMEWLNHVRIFYWGDLDAHGFEALSLLRTNFPGTLSVMMDSATFVLFSQFAKKAAPYTARAQLCLSDSEVSMFKLLNNEGKMLEQERITLRYAEDRLRAALGLKA